MEIQVKCYATLSDNESCNYKRPITLTLERHCKVDDVIRTVGLNANDVKLSFVNGKQSDAHTPLNEGDRIGLFPPVGGM